MDTRFEDMRKVWYQAPPVLFEVVKQLVHRETTFLREGCVHRNLKTFTAKYLLKNMERYHFFEEPFNHYHSLSTYQDMPVFSFNRMKKKEEQLEWNKVFKDKIIGFDLLLDFDSEEDLAFAYMDCMKVKKLFDEYKILYTLMFSGKKGFHITIKYNDFPTEFKNKPIEELRITLKEFAENLKINEKLPTLDLSVIDLRRICKTAYSVVYPYYLIAYPLTDQHFESFTLKSVSLPYLITKIDSIYKRGLLTRQGDPENLIKIMNKYR